MKRKELKNLAQKIAKLENIVQTSDDQKAISRAQDEIMTLSGHIQSIEDMVLLDDLIQELMNKS